MTHSKMVQTRRRREAAKKRQAKTDKLAKKLAQQPARPQSGVREEAASAA